MNKFLLASSIVLFLGGLSHSWFGERLIFNKLRHEHLPQLRGSTLMTFQILRVFWHLATLTWWGMAIQIFLVARVGTLDELLWWWVAVAAGIFWISALYMTAASKGRFRPGVILWVIAICISLGLFLR